MAAGVKGKKKVLYLTEVGSDEDHTSMRWGLGSALPVAFARGFPSRTSVLGFLVFGIYMVKEMGGWGFGFPSVQHPQATGGMHSI